MMTKLVNDQEKKRKMRGSMMGALAGNEQIAWLDAFLRKEKRTTPRSSRRPTQKIEIDEKEKEGKKETLAQCCL